MVMIPGRGGCRRQTSLALTDPLRRCSSARDAIRQLKAADGLKAPVTVMVRGGLYFLSEPFVLSAADSGTEACSIIYMAYPGEKPVLSGGKAITGWKRGELWVAEVPEVKAGKWYFRQLFVNGQRRPRARIPNEGFYTPAEMPPEETWKDAQQPAAFKFNPGEIARWDNLEDVEVVFLRSWDEVRLRIAEVDLDLTLLPSRRPETKSFAGYPVSSATMWRTYSRDSTLRANGIWTGGQEPSINGRCQMKISPPRK